MNKDAFIKLPPSKRVEEVNRLLQDHDLKEISNLIGIPSSSFSKLMREGDYIYHKADKKYYRFIRSEEGWDSNTNTEQQDELSFIKTHISTLKKVIQQFEEQKPLLLDKRIYSKDATFVNKSIRMNQSIYDDFIAFCQKNYNFLKTQDVIAQALIDTMNKYRPEK